MSREALSTTDLRTLHRRSSIVMAILWCLGTLGLFATVLFLGEARHLNGAGMPPVLKKLAIWVFLFPGMHAAVGLARWLGVRPADGWVNLSLFLGAVVISSTFWIGLVPCAMVALRAYVWPWRITAMHGTRATRLKAGGDQW